MYGQRPTFDEKDQAILDERKAARDQIEGPRIGDFVKFADGTYKRFTHDWGTDIQTTSGTNPGDTSFYLGRMGYASFSGSLDPALPKDKMTLTDEVKEGGFWFFHHDYHTGHNGVYFRTACRVYAYNE